MDEQTFNKVIAITKDFKAKQQNEVVRFLVSTAYSFGYKAGVASVAPADSTNK